MKNAKILLIIGLLLVAFGSNAQMPRYIKSDKYEGVIFARNPDLPKLSKKPFMPSNSEIANMENKISGTINNLMSLYKKQHEFFKDQCDIVNNLHKYKRHYFGYLDKGNKIITVFFFRNAPKNWKEGVFFVEGGGCAYFYISYSIGSDTLFDFSINSSE